MKLSISTIILIASISLLPVGTVADIIDYNYMPMDHTDSDDEPFEPTEEHHHYEILGFTVYVSGRAADHKPEKTEAALWGLRAQISHLVNVLPMHAVKRLRHVKIWLTDDSTIEENPDSKELCPHACYYPEIYWSSLLYDFNMDKRGSVEFRNMEFLTKYTRCCSNTLIHEMSHAYHDQFLSRSFSNSDIESAFEDAKESGLYDEAKSMFSWYVEPELHYGMTDRKEFFATMTETYFYYFSRYPFVAGDLYEYDRDTFDLMRAIWHSEEEDDYGRIITSSEVYVPMTNVPSTGF
ncbi:MAG: hypothetical protein OXC84_02420 [Gammaproteobacteria bacterium]|nr:hypothetical protein [Gammaproteobacteria bacterium]